MFFRNLQIYRLPANYALAADALERFLAPGAFIPCSSNEMQRQGWVSPRDGGSLVHEVGGQFLLRLMTEKKILPVAVINQVAKEKAAELEEQQGFPPGRKAMKDLKERVADELLPRAFALQSGTYVWIDPRNGWLVVDAASPSKADDAIKHLLKAIDKMPLESVRVARSPTAVMTGWLEADEAPAGFTVDKDAEMQSTGESRAKVKYVHHTLQVDDLRRHIAAGKQCTRLAMTWNDRISFVLTESLAIKSVKPLDVIKENDGPSRDEMERFDSDFALMSGELDKMLTAILGALGGEVGDLASPAHESVKAERAIRITAALYQARDDAKVLLGEGFQPRVQTLRGLIESEMKTNQQGAIEAAMAVCKRQASPANNIFIMATAVEIVEPSVAP